MVQAQALSRRDRVRAATTQEILQTARQLLVDQGASAISLRAIAREMGMTAPALYRYFGSHEELLRHVVGDIFTDLAQHVRAAIEAAAEAAGSDRAPEDLMAVKLIAGCREFRAWALTHVPEFDMIFGSPLPGLHLDHTDPVAECGYQFGQVFLDLFGNLYRRRPFPIQTDDEIDPSLRRQLTRYRDLVGTDLPLGALLTFLRCWVLLYGMVALEVGRHLEFALDDSAPMFELMLSDLAPMVGLEYPAYGAHS
ncbi:MAG TPA: TetR/AcrR family transcriptional regulator [Streptosporangiaceae bacterium]|jgi:AcrR family transcriptional regulator|nr:TetR/AcrR family transcriptional regulator [Streptosporangiaceae bacterium]